MLGYVRLSVHLSIHSSIYLHPPLPPALLTKTQIPGLLHAWYVIARYPEDEGYYEGLPEHNESGHVTYVFVQPAGEGQPQPKPQHQHQHQHHQGGMNYGTTATNPTSGGGSSSSAPAAAAAPQENGGEGGSNGSSNPPPTYAEAVKGDHKVQTQD